MRLLPISTFSLGLDTSNGSQCALHPASKLDPLGHHATTCRKRRCGHLPQLTARQRLAIEPTDLSVKVEMGSNLTPDHDHSHPADIFLPNWTLGKPVAFDISLTSPLSPNVLSVTGLSAETAALLYKEDWMRGKLWCR